MREKPILQIENFRMCFNGPDGPVHAVRDVNLTVCPGEVVALVGESGSGKTALCRSILTLHTGHARYISGRIQLNGRNVLELDPTEMENVRGRDGAMIFQDPLSSLNPVLRIEEQLSIPLRKHLGMKDPRDLRAKALELLKEVGLSDAEAASGDRLDILHRYPRELSGGQRQRIAIAIALACNPALLIADEPTASLDEVTGRNMMSLFRDLVKRKHKGILVITHDIRLAGQMADRILVMRKGEIIEEGTSEEIFRNPQHEYTKKLVAYASWTDHQVNTSEEAIHASKESERPFLRIENLRYRYPKARCDVFRNLNLEIRQGEILGLAGESGSGKTTFAKVLCSQLDPSEGSIHWRDGDVSPQLIFQDSMSAFNERMTVMQIIEEPLVLRDASLRKSSKKRCREEAERMAAVVGLPKDLLHRHPYELSGGQRQRVAIARAMVRNPRFLIADEPLSALDIPVQAEILELLSALRAQENLTLIIIGHNLPILYRYCDRILLMEELGK